MFTLVSKLNLGPLENLTPKLRYHASRAIRMTAFEIEGEAKMAAPVDTGALRASIYTVTKGYSGHEDAIADAESVYWSNKLSEDPSAGMPVSPAVPALETDLVAVVAVGMAYGAHLEYGTINMAAQPFMAPAAERGRGYFAEQMSAAIRAAASDAGWTP